MKLLFLILLLASFNSFALKFQIDDNDEIVGKVKIIYTKENELFADLAEKYDVGFLQLSAANPYVDPWLAITGTEVVLPQYFILPANEREGIVINLAEYRLYYYPPKKKGNKTQFVYTYPIGIGRDGWESPVTHTTIRAIEADPAWYPPQSIIDEHFAEYGETLPKIVPPGPDNPLGPYKLSLSLPGYLIHGSNKEFGVGMRVSHGCFRMFNHHVSELANAVKRGTKVTIIKERFKFGKKDNQLFLEAHPALEDDIEDELTDYYDYIVEQVRRLNKKYHNRLKVDWNALREAVYAEEGLPTPIAVFL